MTARSFAFALASALTLAVPATAQEYAELAGGFGPSTYDVTVYAGGDIDASSIGARCVGMVGETPQMTLSFTGYGGPLIISAFSEADTSLAVQAPDGLWYCNDDTNGLNPRVNWNSADTGTYRIHVGAVGASAQGVPLVLSIEE
jgi:hypothetical protein